MTKVQEQLIHDLNMLCETTILIKDRAIELRDLVKEVDFYGNTEIEQLKKLLVEKDLIIKRYLEKEGEKC